MKRKVGDIVKLHGSDVMKDNPANIIMCLLGIEFEEGIECEIVHVDEPSPNDIQPYQCKTVNGTNPFGTDDALFWCNDDEIMEILLN